MAGVVFEGGSLRGVFSAGVMDALLDNKILFDYVIGVSAGISYGISYVSAQSGRNLEVFRKYRGDSRYCSLRNYFRYGSMFGMDFLYDEIPNKLNILDREAVDNYAGRVVGVVTDASNGQAVYMDAKHMGKKFTLLRASAAVPFYTPPVYIEGKRYFDGGMSDSIPIKKSIAEGNDKNLIVLTQPLGFKKKTGKSDKIGAFLLKRKYPAMSKILLERADMYNETLQYISELEAGNDTVVLRPMHHLRSLESDVNVLENTYYHGYDVAQKNMDSIRKILD